MKHLSENLIQNKNDGYYGFSGLLNHAGLCLGLEIITKNKFETITYTTIYN